MLLLDEPSLGLAPLIVQQVYRVIADISPRRHHRAAGGAECPYGVFGRRPRLLLETGQLVVHGKPKALWDNEDVRTAYLGGRRT